MFWNIQGIGSKLELESINKLISVSLFQIKRLYQNQSTYNPLLKNHHFIHCEHKYRHQRAKRPSGGIAVLIKNTIKHIVKIEKINEHVIWLSIKQKQQPSLMVGGTYIPPAGSKIYLNYEINDIFQALQTDIGNFLLSTPFVALCGDFNSRTGGLSDMNFNVNGKDSDVIASLHNIINIPESAQNTVWQTKNRLMKDKVHNNFGKELIQLCVSSNMRIMNGFFNEQNTDEFTCHAPLGRSTVDYLLCTHPFFNIMNNFEVCPKLVESDHVPMTFSVTSKADVDSINCSKYKNSPSEKRFQYVFDKSKIALYKDSLRSDSAQDKLSDLTLNFSEGTEIDSLIKSTYNFLESSIQAIFKKRVFKSISNTFPVNAWYDSECKSARKIANDYAKRHDLNMETHNLRYKTLHKQYRYTVQRKKRSHQQQNRDELERLTSSNQTECWKLWNKLTNKKSITSNLPDINTFHEYFTKQSHPPNCQHFDQEHMIEINNLTNQIKANILPVPNNISADICDSHITESEVKIHNYTYGDLKIIKQPE